MYNNDEQPQSKGPPRFGKLAILSIALLTVLGMAGIMTAAAQGTQEISAKALDDHDCDDTEWHFVITQIDGEANAPASIHVTWANGTEEDVPLDKFSGKVAHYNTTTELNSTVTNATAEIYVAWDGQFNLSHGPCNDIIVPPLDDVPCPDLTVTPEAGPVNSLNWTAVADADNYKVYRATDGENFTLLATLDGGNLTYEDTDVEQGQTFQYMVTAIVDDLESQNCEPVEVTTIPVFSTALAAAAAGLLGIGGYVLARRGT